MPDVDQAPFIYVNDCCRDARGMTLDDRDGRGLCQAAIQKARDRQRVGAGTAPRLHSDLPRQAEAEGVIQRHGGGFPLDQSRIAYLRYLRREKQRELVPRADFDAVIDGIAGVVLTHLRGKAARCSNDLMVRRKIDAVVYEVRKEMETVALEMADKNGEPLLDQQG